MFRLLVLHLLLLLLGVLLCNDRFVRSFPLVDEDFLNAIQEMVSDSGWVLPPPSEHDEEKEDAGLSRDELIQRLLRMAKPVGGGNPPTLLEDQHHFHRQLSSSGSSSSGSSNSLDLSSLALKVGTL